MTRNARLDQDAAAKSNAAPLIIISPPKHSSSSRSRSSVASQGPDTNSPTPQQKMFKSIASAIAVASSLRESSASGKNSEISVGSSDKNTTRAEKLKQWKAKVGRRAGTGGGIGQPNTRKSRKATAGVKKQTKRENDEEALVVDGCITEKKKGGMFTMFFSPGNGNPCGF